VFISGWDANRHNAKKCDREFIMHRGDVKKDCIGFWYFKIWQSTQQSNSTKMDIGSVWLGTLGTTQTVSQVPPLITEKIHRHSWDSCMVESSLWLMMIQIIMENFSELLELSTFARSLKQFKKAWLGTQTQGNINVIEDGYVIPKIHLCLYPPGTSNYSVLMAKNCNYQCGNPGTQSI